MNLTVISGNSFLWETGGPFLFSGSYDESFSLDLILKDIHLMYDMAKEAKVIQTFAT